VDVTKRKNKRDKREEKNRKMVSEALSLPTSLNLEPARHGIGYM
jgi:hypothetical protein